MKIESCENAVRLIPENDWERDQLLRVSKGVESVNFEDEWNRTGYLSLNLRVHPWNKK